MSNNAQVLLLIDDNKADRRFHQRLLQQSQTMQFDFVESDSVEQALDILSEQAVDCILLDHKLPGASGVDGLAQIGAAADKAPVILLTELEDHTLDLAAMQQGATDYLVKNKIDSTSLERAVRYAIGRRNNEKLAAETARLHALIETAGALGHEINNPLTAITLGLHALTQAELDEDQRSMLEDLQQAARRITVLTEQMTDIKSYRTKHYTQGQQIVDIAASAKLAD